MPLAGAAPSAREGPLRALAGRRTAEGLRPDAAQDAAAAMLQRLHDALDGYRPPARPRRRLLRLGAPATVAPPRGVYLHGPVGRGKTMLMDLFFAGAPVERKRRTHFSALMIEVHERLHALRRQPHGSGDLVPKLAAALAEEAWLLCLDELQVDNIGDAMLLHRLFAGLLDAGTVIVATSNWAPDELYAGGLQRDRFLPFIALVEERMTVVHLDDGEDYRRARLAGIEAYRTPLDAAAEAAIADAVALLAEGAALHPVEVRVGGRTLRAGRSARDLAWFTFEELCGRPLGSADYHALARRFPTIALSGIPVLDTTRRDEARRFILLIDVLYESGTKLICTAAAPPDRLFAIPRDARIAARAVSRLIEMRSPEYLDRSAAAKSQVGMSILTCPRG